MPVNIQPNPNAALYAKKHYASPQAMTPFVPIWICNLYPNAGGCGEYGVSSDGEFIYTSKWNSAGDQTSSVFLDRITWEALISLDLLALMI